ncbi:MAG: hypothetical protein QM533_03000 [Cytophagales bacterium]|nr:hypothetical protein [Cytophagales bacterium]
MWAAFKGLFAAAIILCVVMGWLLLNGHALTWHMIFVLPVLGLGGAHLRKHGNDLYGACQRLRLLRVLYDVIFNAHDVHGRRIFPSEQLPKAAQVITEYMPLTVAVNLVRPLFLGAWPEHVFINISVLLVVAVISFVIVLRLLRKRF